jgi:hypothetical protein
MVDSFESIFMTNPLDTEKSLPKVIKKVKGFKVRDFLYPEEVMDPIYKHMVDENH